MPLMAGTVKWERLAGLRTPVLMMLAFASIAVGVFRIYTPAGWIFVGLALLFIAYVTDPEAVPGGRTR